MEHQLVTATSLSFDGQDEYVIKNSKKLKFQILLEILHMNVGENSSN